MLCIIFGEIPEDMEKKYVYNTSMYFDNTYLGMSSHFHGTCIMCKNSHVT